jgi:hypothetical protein
VPHLSLPSFFLLPHRFYGVGKIDRFFTFSRRRKKCANAANVAVARREEEGGEGQRRRHSKPVEAAGGAEILRSRNGPGVGEDDDDGSVLTLISFGHTHIPRAAADTLRFSSSLIRIFGLAFAFQRGERSFSGGDAGGDEHINTSKLDAHLRPQRDEMSLSLSVSSHALARRGRS